MRTYEKKEPKHIKGEPFEKKWKIREKGYEVTIETRTGKREDFKWKSSITAIKNLSNPTENTTIIEITRIVVTPGCDDVTAKMCVKKIIENLQGNNILILVIANTLFNETYFRGLNFKKSKVSLNDKWLAWQYPKLYASNKRWYDERVL